MSRRPASAHALLVAACLAPLAGAGCASRTYLMPTPAIYADPRWNPFADVPPALQDDEVAVLYVTDRRPEGDAPHGAAYGSARSRSAAFGEATVRFGKGLTWDQLMQASRTQEREDAIELRLETTREIARFAPTPATLVLTDAQMASRDAPPPDPVQLEAERRFREEIAARLAQTPRKEVFVYVHGFNDTFEDAVLTGAEMWHFLGREGVPIAYTWPAGVGSFTAYEYTLASTQFTIFHFKRFLRLLASCPEVEKVHILAHSRGTAVTTEGLRELHLEIRGTADTRETLKLGTVVLAAADMDLDVVIARDATERIGRAAERSAIYITERDKALGLSTWLFGGRRLGRIDLSLFAPEEISALRTSHRLQIIDARVSRLGAFGHSYFHQSPAVSSDLALLLRYGLLPGAAHGRPLRVTDLGLWIVDDEYPGAAWEPPTALRRRPEMKP